MDHPEIAKLKAAYRCKVSQITLRDANADRQSVSIPTGSAYAIRLAIKLGGRKTEVYVGDELACISTFGDFDLPRFTVNAPDRCGFRSESAGTVRVGVDKLAIFTEDGDISDVQSRVLDSQKMRTLIAFHSFREGEAIHFYRNCVVLYARKEDATPELIELMNALANALPIRVKLP
jgi:hypothetical protein